MIGAIIGDTVGSRFEFHNAGTKDFEFLNKECSPTDDSIMTIALAEAILQWDDEGRPSYGRLSDLAVISMRMWGRDYPYAGYGGHFARWLESDSMGPYGSCGNGAAMRISPVGWAARSLKECVEMSRAVTQVTHNHPDGIKGAEATAVQIYMAKNGMKPEELKEYEEEHYYPIEHNLNWYLENYDWHSLCDGTCQAAYECLYESMSYEEAVRNCILVGGDCDTTGAICGGIAEAVWGIPEDIENKVYSYLDEVQIALIEVFQSNYCRRYLQSSI